MSRGKLCPAVIFYWTPFVSITLYGESDESLLDKPFERIAVLNSSLTAFEAGSDLGLIKENAGIKPVAVFRRYLQNHRKEPGLFSKFRWIFRRDDRSVSGSLGYSLPGNKRSPSIEAINAAKIKTDYTKIVLNPTDQSVYLTEAGMAVNLGAIAKGYIADEVMAALEGRRWSMPS